MSRFFQNANDSESSESDFSSGSEFSDNELEQKQTGTVNAGRFARPAYDSDDESDEEVKRVMKTPRVKHTDEMVKLSSNILKAARADEWQAV
ncbi:hypothetical protein GGF43_006604, partial [Coemansia sp. RSA 2618]